MKFLSSFRKFVNVNEGNYGDPDMDTKEWPGKEKAEEKGDINETPEERKNRLDALFNDEDYGSETGY